MNEKPLITKKSQSTILIKDSENIKNILNKLNDRLDRIEDKISKVINEDESITENDEVIILEDNNTINENIIEDKIDEKDVTKEDEDFTFENIDINPIVNEENIITKNTYKIEDNIKIGIFILLMFFIFLFVSNSKNETNFNYPNNIKLKKQIDTIALDVNVNEMENYKLDSNFTFYEIFQFLEHKIRFLDRSCLSMQYF